MNKRPGQYLNHCGMQGPTISQNNGCRLWFGGCVLWRRSILNATTMVAINIPLQSDHISSFRLDSTGQGIMVGTRLRDLPTILPREEEKGIETGFGKCGFLPSDRPTISLLTPLSRQNNCLISLSPPRFEISYYGDWLRGQTEGREKRVGCAANAFPRERERNQGNGAALHPAFWR